MTDAQCKLELIKWCQNNKKDVCEYCGYDKKLTTKQFSIMLVVKNWICGVPKESECDGTGEWNREFSCELYKIKGNNSFLAMASVRTDTTDSKIIDVDIRGDY